MKRWSLNILTLLSLLLCIGTALLWIRSYHIEDGCGLIHRNLDYEVESHHTDYWDWRYTQFLDGVSSSGAILLSRETLAWNEVYPDYPSKSGNWHWERFSAMVTPDLTLREHLPVSQLGFGAWDQKRYPIPYVDSSSSTVLVPNRKFGISFPHWLLVGLTAVMPTLFLRRQYLMQRRRSDRVCSTCGYDLRATPERCPECGTLIAPKKNVTTA